MPATVLFTCLLLAAAPPSESAPAARSGVGRTQALLIGCSHYPSLAAVHQLEGPTNDVELLESLLVERFDVSRKAITKLIECADAKRLPTRANIEREFRALADRAGPDDSIVILLSGHGSQQPNGADPGDPEPDGLDEVFLPRDIGPWNGRNQRIENAIIDDEIGVWLAAIRDKGARIWVLADACHCGTLVRGGGGERSRFVPAEEMVPQGLLNAARRDAGASADRTRGSGPRAEALDVPLRGGITALYAAQSAEPTVELPLPPDGVRRRPYGLLTYSVCNALLRSHGPLTYRELVRRVYEQYRLWGRSHPVPFLEGTELDRQVLGARTGDASSLVLTLRADGSRQVDGGTLRGLTAGSILSVSPPGTLGEGAQILGFVQVRRADVLSSDVEPVAYEGRHAEQALPSGGVCRLVYRDYGDFRLRVAVAHADVDGRLLAPETRQRLRTRLERAVVADRGPVRIVESDDVTRWFLTTDADGRLYLHPASGWSDDARKPDERSLDAETYFGPSPTDEPSSDWLRERLERITRVETLFSVAARNDAAGSFRRPRIELQIVRLTDSGPESVAPAAATGERLLHPGERVQFRVTNRGGETVDVTLFYIDERLGITTIVPREGFVGDSRLGAGETVESPPARVTASKRAEHVLAIAVAARAQTPVVDLSWLAQPSLEAARERRAAQQAPQPSVARLLQTALFAEGATRGLDVRRDEDFSCALLGWRVLAEATKPEK